MGYITIEEVDMGFRVCRRHKAKSRGYVEYSQDYLMENYRLWQDLNSMCYEVGKSRCFIVTRPKLREVFCAMFRDRIVHTILAIKFLPILEEEMSDCAFACRKGKGTDYGIKHVKQEIERVSENYTKEAWVAKYDIEGFFMSIHRERLYNLLENVIRAKYDGEDIEWWLWLWRKVVLNCPEKNCEKVGDITLWDKLPDNKTLFKSGGKGLPIGNLPSQLLANLLLAQFDKWMVERLQGGGYGRYVDDFVCISTDKKLLLRIAHEAREKLAELGLTLHRKKFYLQEVKKGVEMTGAVIKQGRIYAANRNVNNLFNVIDEWNRSPYDIELFVSRINSYFGHLRGKASYGIRWEAWNAIQHKEGLCCVNMKKIKRIKHIDQNGQTKQQKRAAC